MILPEGRRSLSLGRIFFFFPSILFQQPYLWTPVTEPTSLLNPSVTFYHTICSRLSNARSGACLLWCHSCKVKSDAYLRESLVLPFHKTWCFTHNILSLYFCKKKSRVRRRDGELQKSREIHGRTVHWKAISFTSLHHQINSLLNQPEKWVWNLYKLFLCYQNSLLFTIQCCLLTDLGFKTNTPKLFTKKECRDSLTCAIHHVLCFISSDLCLWVLLVWDQNVNFPLSSYQIYSSSLM